MLASLGRREGVSSRLKNGLRSAENFLFSLGSIRGWGRCGVAASAAADGTRQVPPDFGYNSFALLICSLCLLLQLCDSGACPKGRRRASWPPCSRARTRARWRRRSRPNWRTSSASWRPSFARTSTRATSRATRLSRCWLAPANNPPTPPVRPHW